jgi:4-amino-4-deoxy-L-arabinose transferase-like glycosyltransferase
MSPTNETPPPDPSLEPDAGATKTTTPDWWRRSFWAVLAVALALRASWALALPIIPVSDGRVYDLFARNIAEGHGYCFVPGEPTAYWPVGTAAMYAPIYAAFEETEGPVKLLNVLIGVAVVALTTLLTRDWFGHRAAIAAGALMAAWPGQIQFASTLSSEIAFNLGWLAALYVATRPSLPPWLRAATAGVALAAACYVRPVALLLPAVFAWIRLVGPGGPRPLFSRKAAGIVLESAATLAVMLALIAPWTIRNARAFGSPVLVSANGGANLWMGNNPETDGGYMPLPKFVAGLDEATRDARLKDEAMRYIRERPAAFVVRTVVKLLRTHERETIGVAWNEPGLARTFGPSVLSPLKVLSSAYWYAALGLSAIGIVGAIRGAPAPRWLGQPALVFWAYFAVLHAVIVSGDRYHYPSIPAIAALAGLGIVILIDLRKPGRPS